MLCVLSPQPLQIKSVVAKEGLKGYIYVEAYKQTHVKQAIEGVGNLRMGQWQQQMVPIKEMTDVLRVVKEMAHLREKQWVRLKRGIFKDDLAQVRAQFCSSIPVWTAHLSFPPVSGGLRGAIAESSPSEAHTTH